MPVCVRRRQLPSLSGWVGLFSRRRQWPSSAEDSCLGSPVYPLAANLDGSATWGSTWRRPSRPRWATSLRACSRSAGSGAAQQGAKGSLAGGFVSQVLGEGEESSGIQWNTGTQIWNVGVIAGIKFLSQLVFTLEISCSWWVFLFARHTPTSGICSGPASTATPSCASGT